MAAKKKTTTAANSNIVETAHDPFNGFVYLKTDGTNFWAEHERKSVSSKPASEKEARKAFTAFIDDTQF